MPAITLRSGARAATLLKVEAFLMLDHFTERLFKLRCRVLTLLEWLE